MNGRPQFTVPSQVPSGNYMAESHLERIPTAFESFAQTALGNIKAARAQKAAKAWEREKVKTELLHRIALANVEAGHRRKIQEEGIRLEPEVKGEFLERERGAEYENLVDVFKKTGVPEEEAQQMVAKRIYLAGGGYYGSQAWEPPTKPIARGGAGVSLKDELARLRTTQDMADQQAKTLEVIDNLKQVKLVTGETTSGRQLTDDARQLIAVWNESDVQAVYDELGKIYAYNRQLENLAKWQIAIIRGREGRPIDMANIVVGGQSGHSQTRESQQLRRNAIEALEGTEEPEGEIYLPE